VVSLAEAIFTDPEVSGSGLRTWKDQYRNPQFDFLQADTIALDPFISDYPANCAEVEGSTFCRMTVNYKTPTNDEKKEDNNDEGEQDETTTFEHRMEIGGEFLTMPARNWHWESDGIQVVDDDIPIGKILCTIEHEFHWPRVFYPPMSAIRSTIGKLNQFPFAGAAAETLLFLGVSMSRIVTAKRVKAWDVTYKMSERAVQEDTSVGGTITWNHFYRPDQNKWDILSRVGDGKKVYSVADYVNLFKMGALNIGTGI
jgi:hypothetical protein